MTASKLEESIEALANSLFRPDKGKWRRDDFIAGLKYFAEAVREECGCGVGTGVDTPCPKHEPKCWCNCCWNLPHLEKDCHKAIHPAALPDEVLEEVDSLAKAYAETAIGSGVNPSVYRDRLIKLCLRVGEKRLEEKRK